MDREIRTEITEVNWQPAIIKPYKDWCKLHKNLAVTVGLDLDFYQMVENRKIQVRLTNRRIARGFVPVKAGACRAIEVHPEDEAEIAATQSKPFGNWGMFECQVITE